MTLAVGTRLGSYEVVAQIGAGGMGEVYQAHDTKLGRDVAIKVLPPAFAHDPDRLSRFQREAKTLASLNHPNIATIHGLEQFDGVNYLVMELVPGQTLAERVSTGALKIEEALKVATQIAEALEAAHEKGVIHRDLKPANVKVTLQGKVKVLDFGLAKAFAGDSGQDLSHAVTLTAMGTEEGIILGTPAYMSPEQTRGKSVDKRTDIWAFGCVLYELLTGKQAFPGETVSDALAAVLEREPDLQVLPPATPAKIQDLLRRCLRKDSQYRLRDIGDARIEIEEALAAPAMAEPSAPVEVIRVRRREALLWGVAFLLLAGIAVGFLSLSRRAPEPPVYHQVTFRRGSIRRARFAPDGKTILYGASFEGHGSQIYWTRSESPESTALPFQNAVVQAVSSSGELAIGLRRGSTITLAEVPLAGGAPREILDGLVAADWAPDGENLAVVHTVGDRDRIELPVGKVLYDPGPGVSLGNVRFSPGGDLIAFVEYGHGDSICVVDRNGKHRVVSGGWADAMGLAWNPVSGEIWFNARGRGESSGGLVLHALPEHVIDGVGDQHDQERDAARAVAAHPLAPHRVAGPVHHQEQQDARHPGVGGAPAEPIQRARHQLRDHLLPRVGIVRFRHLCVDEVEEPEMADPHHAGQHMDPTEDEVQPLGDARVHPPLPGKFPGRTLAFRDRSVERDPTEGPSARGTHSNPCTSCAA